MRRAVGLSLLALCLSWAPVGAQDADPDKALAKRLESTPVTLNFDQTPLADVAAFLGDLSQVSVVVAPGVDADQPITAKLEGVSLKDALKLIASSGKDLQARPWCGVLWIGPKGQRLPAMPEVPAAGKLAKKVTLHFDETPLDEVLAFLQDVSGLKLTLTPAAQAKLKGATVTLAVRDMPAIRALTLIGALHRLSCQVEGDQATLDLDPQQQKSDQAPERKPPGQRGR